MTTRLRNLISVITILVAMILLAGCAHQVQPGEDPHPSSWVGLADASGTALALSGVVPTAGTNSCANATLARSSAAISASGAAATLVVAGVSGEKVHLCGVMFSLSGTTPTATVETGTQTTNPCDTGTVALTGAIAPTAGGVIAYGGGGGDIAVGASGAQICILLGGTTPAAAGIATFVQD